MGQLQKDLGLDNNFYFMYESSNQAIFHSEYDLHEYYYSSRINKISTKLSRLLNNREKIHFFPEATLKSNNFPNGIAIYSPLNKTTLIPTLLRDPGCGYLLFRIPTDKNHLIAEESLKIGLHQFGNLLESKKICLLDPTYTKLSFLKSILNNGIDYFNNACQDRFTHKKFVIEQDLCLTDEDYSELYDELNNVTNTIEIKKVIDFDKASNLKNAEFNAGDILGFIHTGTDIFPTIILRHFFKKIADYSYINRMASVDDIRSGLYGVPLSNELGYRYYQWVKAAMNYCLAKRWLIYNKLAHYLKEKFDFRLEMINDRIHAGAFEKTLQNQQIFNQIRGVQDFFYTTKNEYKNYYLLAGQRESISFLVTPSLHIKEGTAIGHGTSYAIDPNYNYPQLLGVESSQIYLNMCDNLSANTRIEKQLCLPYTFNILSQLQYLIDQQYCSSVHCLMPLANYQGKSLIKKLLKDK